MPYQPHTLITCGGKLYETGTLDEIWQVGVRGFNQGGGPVGQGQLQALATHVATGDSGNTGLAKWFTDSVSHIGNATQLNWVKCVNIGANGDYTGAPAIYQFGTPVLGGSAADAPSFCCVALSWTTGKSFGRARGGRIYPPNFGATRSSGAQITSSVQADLVQSALEFLSAVDVSGDQYDFNPSVVSASGVSNPITGVRVGNIYDTQRKRKDATRETYVSSPR